jgi:hypothetical protein
MAAADASLDVEVKFNHRERCTGTSVLKVARPSQDLACSNRVPFGHQKRAQICARRGVTDITAKP